MNQPEAATSLLQTAIDEQRRTDSPPLIVLRLIEIHIIIAVHIIQHLPIAVMQSELAVIAALTIITVHIDAVGI